MRIHYPTGLLSCLECPVFDTRITRWPIFERRSLSLKKQQSLRKWMISEAIASAEHLLAAETGARLPLPDGTEGSRSLGSSYNSRSPAGSRWDPLTGMAWSHPMNLDFFGETAHNDRAAGVKNDGLDTIQLQPDHVVNHGDDVREDENQGGDCFIASEDGETMDLDA